MDKLFFPFIYILHRAMPHVRWYMLYLSVVLPEAKQGVLYGNNKKWLYDRYQRARRDESEKPMQRVKWLCKKRSEY
jgi:hypothetical protein